MLQVIQHLLFSSTNIRLSASLATTTRLFGPSIQGKDCGIKTALSNLAKRYLTLHPSSTKVERLFSIASNVLDGRNLTTESQEKLVFLKENLKLRNFALDWWTVGLLKATYMYIESFGCWWKSFTVFVFWFSLIGKISEPVPVNL